MDGKLRLVPTAYWPSNLATRDMVGRRKRGRSDLYFAQRGTRRAIWVS